MVNLHFNLLPTHNPSNSGVEMIFHYVSGLREETSELCVNEILDFSLKLAGKYLNGKKMKILEMIATHKEPMTITSAVNMISHMLRCPKSTVWANINFLKELGLIENGRGKPVKLTKIGRLMLKGKSDEELEEMKL